MNPKLKNVLMITLKNAVNSVITSGCLMVLNNGAFNIRDANGWWNLGKVVASTIIAREITVWGPVILKWSSTSANPSADLVQGGGVYVPPIADRK